MIQITSNMFEKFRVPVSLLRAAALTMAVFVLGGVGPTKAFAQTSTQAEQATSQSADPSKCMVGMDMPGCTARQAEELEKQKAANHCMPGMDMPGCPANKSGMGAELFGGPFQTMNAMGSGTSLMPATSPVFAHHFMVGNWMMMLHYEIDAGFNLQTGPRGASGWESTNWGMFMAEHKAGPGQFMFRSMLSAEPFTLQGGLSPLLFQTGETFHGKPIIDAQHPHDLFMELAMMYTLPVSKSFSFYVYGGPVGEPALGPVAFMHRDWMLLVPIFHHTLDSTHISDGVVTLGANVWRFRLEGSVFNGREPDEDRKDIDLGRLDSRSFRVSFAPNKNWVGQFSYGYLVHPEALEPGNLTRMTTSISYNKPFLNGNWASSLMWGRNHEQLGNFNAYLGETAVNFHDRNDFFARYELGDKHGLGEENIFGAPGTSDPLLAGRPARVSETTLGVGHDFMVHPFRMGVRFAATYDKPADSLVPEYGKHPMGFRLSLVIRPPKH